MNPKFEISFPVVYKTCQDVSINTLINIHFDWPNIQASLFVQIFFGFWSIIRKQIRIRLSISL